MSRVRISFVHCFSVVVAASAIACGGGGGDGADAGDTGPCVGTFNMAWPSIDDPQFCMLQWDTTKPGLELTECGEVFELCSNSGPVADFSCIDTPPGDPPETPDTVTITGFVDVFSSGPNSNNARVFIYRESEIADTDNLDAATPLASFDVVLDNASLVEARSCPSERDFMQGQCVIPTEDCGGQCDKDLAAGQFCWETACEDLQRWEIRYSVADIPTNEFLAIRTVGLDEQGEPQVLGNTWAQMMQTNVMFKTNDRACDDDLDTDCIDTTVDPALYRTDVNLLSAQDYMTIPTSAGLSAGITAGNGAIAGEVHDCNGVRVRHAQVGFSLDRDPRVLVYFNGNPVKTLPRLQQSAEGTNTLGLYSGLDVTTGPIELVGVGVEDSALREVGRYATRIWADTVTLVRLGGGRPAQ